MFVRHSKNWLSIFFASLALIVMGSCVNTKKATYFYDVNDSRIRVSAPIPLTVVQPGDIIEITVTSLNSEASKLYNEQALSNTAGVNRLRGYLVSQDGTIQFPVLGNLRVLGKTKEEIKTDITTRMVDKKLLLDPVVSIRFQNFRVTVLGEVKNPTVIPVPNEKISILEAIGLAGDLTIHGKRDNILLIREIGGEKMVKRLSLNSTDLLSSEYYYLQSNDVIYVEPNKAKVASAGRSQAWIPITFSALSFGIIALDRINRQ